MRWCFFYFTESETKVVTKKVPEPTKGREIIDYSDMFVKKSASLPEVTVKKSVKITARPAPSSQPQLSVRLPKGPPKV